MNSFYSAEELPSLGLKSFGKDVLISRKASIYGASQITIGNNVRIDDFCILSGSIEIKNHIHIAAGAQLFGGQAGIVLEDFSGISGRSAVYAESDDYSGDALTGPCIAKEFRTVHSAKVVFHKFSLAGSGATILPGVVLAEGAVVGAMSLMRDSTNEWTIYAGIPAKPVKQRNKNLLLLEKQFIGQADY